MDELKKVVKNKGTEYILEDFLSVIQNNYGNLNW